MSWFRYVIRNWKKIRPQYAVLGNEQPGKTWSPILTNSPYLEGVKLWLPQSVYLYAGHINLKTREIVREPHVTPLGEARLTELFNHLTEKANE
jgi:hypothetical protein